MKILSQISKAGIAAAAMAFIGIALDLAKEELLELALAFGAIGVALLVIFVILLEHQSVTEAIKALKK